MIGRKRVYSFENNTTVDYLKFPDSLTTAHTNEMQHAQTKDRMD